MCRWFIASETLQSKLDNFNQKPTIKTEIEEQPDLFDSWFTKTYERQVEVPRKQYNLKIYNIENFRYLLNTKHKKNWQIEAEMDFDQVIAQRNIVLNENRLDALKQIKNFLQEHTKVFDVIKIELNDIEYYIVNCTEKTSLGMEICKDSLAAAGKLNQYLYLLTH